MLFRPRTESLEPNADGRPTEEGRKGGEAVRATRTGGRELGRWRGSPPSKAELPSLAGWQKVEGLDCVNSDSQQDLTSGMLKSTALLGEQEG